MKNLVKSLAVVAAAVMLMGFGANRANASGVDFSIGVNLGVPVIPVRAYVPPVYVNYPAPAYRVERIGYVYGHDYRYRHDYRYDRSRHDRDHYRGWDRGHRGYDRNYDGRR